MNIDPDMAQTSPATLLAAALHLLTCSAAHGLSRAKCQALVLQLTTLAERTDTDPLLARTCDELADIWYRLGEELEAHKQEQAVQSRAMAEKMQQALLH